MGVQDARDIPNRKRRGPFIGLRFAGFIQFERRKLQLTEQAAADLFMREKAQKWRCGAVHINSYAIFAVAKLRPALCHADTKGRRYQKRHGSTVIDGVTVKREGFEMLTAIVGC